MALNCSQAVEGKKVVALVDSSRFCVNAYLGRINCYDGIGILSSNQHNSSYGFMAHPIYVIDQKDNTPYGIANVHLYNREMESSPLSQKEKRHIDYKSPIEEKESYKWVGPLEIAKKEALSKAESIIYVMDREADIAAVFQRIPDEKTDVVVRAKENRVILDNQGEKTRICDKLKDDEILGTYEIALPKKMGRKRKAAKVSIKAGSCQLRPKRFKKATPSIPISYVEIKEVGKQIKDPIHWILWTSCNVETLEEAWKIVEIYKKRWEIEVFFKLLKTDGFNIEKTQLGTGRSIRKLTLILMEASIKILQLKAARDGSTSLSVEDMFNKKEIECLKLLNKTLSGKTKKQQNPHPENHLSWASWVIARLAGWKEFYAKNNPPGNKTYKKGLDTFEALMIGFLLND